MRLKYKYAIIDSKLIQTIVVSLCVICLFNSIASTHLKPTKFFFFLYLFDYIDYTENHLGTL